MIASYEINSVTDILVWWGGRIRRYGNHELTLRCWLMGQAKDGTPEVVSVLALDQMRKEGLVEFRFHGSDTHGATSVVLTDAGVAKALDLLADMLANTEPAEAPPEPYLLFRSPYPRFSA